MTWRVNCDERLRIMQVLSWRSCLAINMTCQYS